MGVREPIDLTPLRAALVETLGLRLTQAQTGWRRYEGEHVVLIHERDRGGWHHLNLDYNVGLPHNEPTPLPTTYRPSREWWSVRVVQDVERGRLHVTMNGLWSPRAELITRTMAAALTALDPA